MKQEFKKGDRVLGRENDLREWKEYTFVRYIFFDLNEPEDYPFQVIDEHGVTWDVSQCRHIHEFRDGDKKTPIQQLIEKWEQEKGSYIPNSPIFQEFINDAKEMLEKEKEVIIEAAAAHCYPTYEIALDSAEKYYNETFNTKNTKEK